MRFQLAVVLGMSCLLTCQVSGQEKTAFKAPQDKLSYALGMDLGNTLRKQAIKVDPTIFSQGLKDALSGDKTLLTEEEVRATVTQLQNEMRNNLLAKNKKEGEDFLAQNRTKEGVIVLPSGLQYKILKAGDGKKPTLEDTVICHYRGTLVDGTEFDNSYKRNQTASFPVKGVIKGWTEALQLMPVGSKWQLFIPAALAYADGGMGPISPNSTLIFEVELISIQKPT